MKVVAFLLLTAGILSAGCAGLATKAPEKVNIISSATPANLPAAVQPAPVDEGANAPRISAEEAKKDYDNKAAVFVDTHPKAQYDIEHIAGAINVQANTIKQNFDKIPTGKKIIAYCSCGNEHSSGVLVSELQKKGITNSYALLGGTKAWKDAGYPMEKTK